MSWNFYYYFIIIFIEHFFTVCVHWCLQVCDYMMPGLLALGDAPEEGVGRQAGFPLVPLHSGSRFAGHQQSKGNKYQVEVVFKVRKSEGQRDGGGERKERWKEVCGCSVQ